MPKKTLPVVKPARVSQPVTSSKPKKTSAPALSKSRTTVQAPPKIIIETIGTPEKKNSYQNKLKSLKKVKKLISNDKKGAKIAEMVK